MSDLKLFKLSSDHVTTIGHFGTGNLELTLTSKADVEKARHLIELSYEAN